MPRHPPCPLCGDNVLEGLTYQRHVESHLDGMSREEAHGWIRLLQDAIDRLEDHLGGYDGGEA